MARFCGSHHRRLRVVVNRIDCDLRAGETQILRLRCASLRCDIFYTRRMFETRVATPDDAELIAEHRRSMFAEMGEGDEEQLQAMVRSFVPWVRERLEDGRYFGWLVAREQSVVAGAGVFLMDFPPHWRDESPLRAYLLNFYVAPEARGHGLAYGLLKTAIAGSRSRGIKVVTLHASRFGRPIYERNGFRPTTEMMLYPDGEEALL